MPNRTQLPNAGACKHNSCCRPSMHPGPGVVWVGVTWLQTRLARAQSCKRDSRARRAAGERTGSRVRAPLAKPQKRGESTMSKQCTFPHASVLGRTKRALESSRERFQRTRPLGQHCAENAKKRAYKKRGSLCPRVCSCLNAAAASANRQAQESTQPGLLLSCLFVCRCPFRCPWGFP